MYAKAKSHCCRTNSYCDTDLNGKKLRKSLDHQVSVISDLVPNLIY